MCEAPGGEPGEHVTDLDRWESSIRQALQPPGADQGADTEMAKAVTVAEFPVTRGHKAVLERNIQTIQIAGTK